MIGTSRYRKDLDGLRAIAVLGVCLFHLDPSILPGGFVGVDVFFVLSGYLITGILVPQFQTKSFSASRFFQRRVARIFPALAMMLSTVLIMALWFYPGEDIASIGAAGISAAMGCSNMKFMLQGSYFKITPDTQPLLHTWSLGVEEQYYLCFPVLLLLLTRLFQTLRSVRIVLWGLVCISFFACVATTVFRPNVAFYFMPCRAWELMLGAILAICEQDASASGKKPSSSAGFALGVGGIALSMLLGSEQIAFPGWIAMIPVAFTVHAIACGSERSLGGIHGLVSSSPFVAIGKMSYSIYLWHWPVFCFIDYSYLEWGFGLRIIAKLTATLGIASLMYWGLESPLRRWLARPAMLRVAFVAFAISSVSIAGIGFWEWRTGYYNASVGAIADGGIKIVGKRPGPSVVLYGDSVASSQATAIAELVRESGGILHVMSSAGSKPIPPSSSFDGLMKFMDRSDADLIIISCAWHHYLGESGRIEETLMKIKQKTNGRVLLVGPTPFLPSQASRQRIREHGFVEFEEESTSRAERVSSEAMLDQFAGTGVELLKVSGYFLDQSDRIRFRTPEGWQVYQDYLHLSSYGSQFLWQQLKKKVYSAPEVSLLESTESFRESIRADRSR